MSETSPLIPRPPAENSAPCPNLDTLIAHFAGRLLPGEEQRLHAHFAACAHCRRLAVDLAGQIRSGAASPPEPAGDAATDHRALRPARHRPLLRLAAQFLLLVGAGVLAYQVLRPGRAPLPLAALQFNVLGDAGRRGPAAMDAPLGPLAVVPGQVLTMAVSSAEDIYLWVFLAGTEPASLTSIEQRRHLGSQEPTAFFSYALPGSELPARSFLVALARHEPFRASDQDQVLALLRAAADPETLRAALAAALDCTVQVRELSATAGEPEPKFGWRSRRAQLRNQLPEVTRLLRGGDFPGAEAAARAALAALTQEAPPETGWWESAELARQAELAATLATASAEQQSWFRAAEALRAEVAARMPALAGAADPALAEALLADCRRAQELRRRALAAGHPLLAELTHLEAKILLVAGERLDHALRLLEAARSEYEAALGRHHPRYGDVLNDLAGACRRRGLLDAALLYADDALASYERASADPRAIFEALRALSDMHGRLGNLELARSYAGQAEATLGALHGDPGYWNRLANMHLTNAGVHERAGDWTAAERELGKALDLYHAAQDVRRASSVRCRLAQLLLHTGRHGEAYEQLLRVRADDALMFGDPNPYLALDDYLLGLAAMELGHWPEARTRLTAALAGTEDARRRIEDLQERATVGGAFGLETIADALSRTHLALGETERALEAEERGRARSILDLLRAGAGPATPPPAEVAGFEQAIEAARARKDAAHQDLATALAASSAAAVTAATAELRRALRDEWMAERAAAAGWRQRYAAGQPLPGAQAAALLQPGELLLYYAWGASDLRLFVLAPASEPPLEAHALAEGAPALAALQQRLDRALTRLSRAEPSWPAIAEPQAVHDLHALFQALLPPAVTARLHTAEQLYWVAEPPLDRLPFEALVSAPGSSFAASRFLLDDAPASAYLPSLSVLKALRDVARTASDPGTWNALLVANAEPPAVQTAREQAALAGASPPTNNAGALDPAPEAGTEVAILSPILRRGGARVEVLQGEQATVERTLARAPGRQLLHIAAHGYTGDPLRPYQAGLSLYTAAADGAALRLQDILQHWTQRLLGCELAVLSACESGRGGYGPYADFSLPLGLHCAGVPAVVASTWQVDSGATLHWMCTFYDALFDPARPGKAGALHQAQRQVRAAGADPYFWAAFRYFGDPR